MILPGLTWVSGLTALSTVLVAIPILRGLARYAWARHLDARAAQLEATLGALTPQDRQAAQARIAADRAASDDILDFDSLAPLWVAWMTAVGISLGVVARIWALF